LTPVVLPEHQHLPKNGTAVAFMIVRRPDGRPTGYPMTGLLTSGNLELTTYRKYGDRRRSRSRGDRIAQQVLEHLAHRVARQLVDDLELLGRRGRGTRRRSRNDRARRRGIGDRVTGSRAHR
jgi:hypothetical protein